MATANYKCGNCDGRLAPTDDPGTFECERCGELVTEAAFIDDTAGELRAAGFDSLAEKLEATAEKAREVRADE